MATRVGKRKKKIARRRGRGRPERRRAPQVVRIRCGSRAAGMPERCPGPPILWHVSKVGGTGSAQEGAEGHRRRRRTRLRTLTRKGAMLSWIWRSGAILTVTVLVACDLRDRPLPSGRAGPRRLRRQHGVGPLPGAGAPWRDAAIVRATTLGRATSSRGDFAVTLNPFTSLVPSPCSSASLAIPICQTGTFYLFARGTSMATPHVSGAATLLDSQHGGSLDGSQLGTALQRTGDDLGRKGAGAVYGKGRINVCRAVACQETATGHLPDSDR